MSVYVKTIMAVVSSLSMVGRAGTTFFYIKACRVRFSALDATEVYSWSKISLACVVEWNRMDPRTGTVGIG